MEKPTISHLHETIYNALVCAVHENGEPIYTVSSEGSYKNQRVKWVTDTHGNSFRIVIEVINDASHNYGSTL